MFNHFTAHFATHIAELKKLSLNDLFAQDKKRYEQYQVNAAGLCLDFSRQPITLETLKLLDRFVEEANLKNKVNAMFQGEKINTSEARAVLHVALRGSTDIPELNSQIKHEFDKVSQCVTKLHAQAWLGATQKPITDVVNIGIGGSDLGPRMVVATLKPYHNPTLKVHFIANVDAIDIDETLKTLNPETTLFIVASKSFTTEETLLNANTAKKWLTQKLKGDVSQHFIAITAKPEKAMAWGIKADHIFAMWDFVGGRYSLWSSIGLPIALQIGMEHFKSLLNGAKALDQHFTSAKPSENLPLLLAFLSILNQNFYGAESHAVLPYNQHLNLLPNYLQQVDMESNGKSVTQQGTPVEYQTGVVLWGGVGTNGQHSFHQLLHQGTLRIPVDFILPLKAHHSYQNHQDALIANCLAQAEALRQGNSAQNPNSAKLVPGNKPSNIIFMESLTPATLGALIALYEHKIFSQSLIWDINAFDQWGVELGKQLAKPLEQKIKNLTSLTPQSIAQITN